MIIIRMTGGLGNQMFQYALYLKLCSMGREVKFDDISEYESGNARPIMLWVFDISYPRADREEIRALTDGSMKLSHRVRRKLFGRKSLEYGEKGVDYDGQVLEQENAYLTGYFQSEKYFQGVEGAVRQAFSFPDSLSEAPGKEKVRKYLEQIRSCESVSVHIRRGDYLEKSEIYGGICTEEYYRRAIAYMEAELPGARFFLFSNEPEWVKGWVRRQYGEDSRFVVIEGSSEDNGYLDMYLMSQCGNHVIANSSFSWWGAWLCDSEDKRIIAPAEWMKGCRHRDIYTEGMIRINAEGMPEE